MNAPLLDGLKSDYKLLSELIEWWDKVLEDPKLTSFIGNLKNEFFRKDLNPTGKLVVFTESTDTAQYLTEKLKVALDIPILCISSDNRSKLFETILENFDANLEITKQKNDYNLIITTDVLAEGVNLHRSNIIVHYDTPWNATRLMQRIGRVNRIGSVAETIFNYNFYPSEQGDEEIELYNKALIKLQSFHSAFGEDAQIFTHEELVEQFKLFEEGLPDEEDKRLYYLQFIRKYKDENPREFRRIEKLPLKARTGRKASEENLNETVVFLKSVFKTEFYRIDKQNKVKALTFLEAAKSFEANATELPLTLPESHYTQVQASLETFEKDFFGANTDVVSNTGTDKGDGITKQARKFLRDYKITFTQKKEVKTACDNLIGLIDKGTHTPLPNEVRQLSRKLTKNEITVAQVDNLILTLAKKYDMKSKDEDDDEFSISTTPLPVMIEPDIVISETFI
jgi:superfamily II DNA/RNA helicase